MSGPWPRKPEKVLRPIQETQRKRFQYLQYLYDQGGGDTLHPFDSIEVGKALGYSEDDTEKVVLYLHEERLIQIMGFSSKQKALRLTHAGVREVESAVRKPDQATKHFAPMNVMYVGQMSHSQVQQGTRSSSQVGSFSPENIQLVADLIEKIKDEVPRLGLDPGRQKETEAEIATAESQLSSPRPKPAIVAESLKSLRTIIETGAGAAAGAGLVQLISSVLGRLVP